MQTETLLRSAVAELTDRASADLAIIWRRISSAVEAREVLAEVLPAIVDTYGAAAGAVAAEWYDDLRLEKGVGGRFFAVPAQPAVESVDALIGWGTGPLLGDKPDPSSALTLIQGGLQRRVADVARTTIQIASYDDPKASGWQRQSSGGCTFCQMLAGRGAVYSAKHADFASHDNCNCTAIPAFRGEPLPVRPYVPSLHSSTDADRARVRAYIASH
ncbi:hypothetical protein JGU71_28235 [Antrihabitans sp. YC3-6]|uniref:Uncharacterized protein n=1 Tax=Antrihabitans stalagmiti TaxID=2799499 RepID=A0A934NX57_9NOCA|nr:hypothetical protein [Antrihabitans stalagmiti]MBJ8342785.1 hypothetical protein [Antrihabitans stalagmiti]